MYLVATARCVDRSAIRAESPELWRRVRRFNLPVQLALAAAERVAVHCDNPARSLLASLAPCNGGSPELYRWAHAVADRAPTGEMQRVRMNPTHTLHAVDNLALSSLSISLGNRGAGYGFGGAAGMAWQAIDVVAEQFAAGSATEAIIVAGDQDDGETETGGLGVAAVFSAHRRPRAGADHAVRIVGTDRGRATGADPSAHASHGLAALLDALGNLTAGQRLRYEVPARHGDGIDRVIVIAEAV